MSGPAWRVVVLNNIAIRVQGLSKLYRIGSRERYMTLRETLTNVMNAPLRGLSSIVRRPSSIRDDSRITNDQYIWALKDVSFEVERGEVLGIIGANGAGKTTLLKILCRITEPTRGCAEVQGRIGTLLEVGTGFHPELTGRENIYLNGAILGMRRNEIERKFDEIVAFAEVEKFLDTPVKRYSSGMYVRLAFAVAAHLDPEILVVDEVLAVGDSAFQKKCLGKMDEVAGSGRTVLLVSHNMGAIKSLASKAVFLNRGEVMEIGSPEAVVNHYFASSGTNTSDGLFDGVYIDSHRVHLQKYVGQIKLTSVRFKNANHETSGVHLEGSDILLEIEFSSSIEAEAIEVFVRVRTMEGQLVFTCLPGKRYMKVFPGTYKGLIAFNSGSLLPGVYRGDVVILSNIPQDNVSPAFQFEIISHPRQGDEYRVELLPSLSPTSGSTQGALGIIRMKSFWEDLHRVEG
jgi:lipopolysaccharide transport system ATP-binding protein